MLRKGSLSLFGSVQGEYLDHWQPGSTKNKCLHFAAELEQKMSALKAAI